VRAFRLYRPRWCDNRGSLEAPIDCERVGIDGHVFGLIVERDDLERDALDGAAAFEKELPPLASRCERISVDDDVDGPTLDVGW